MSYTSSYIHLAYSTDLGEYGAFPVTLANLRILDMAHIDRIQCKLFACMCWEFTIIYIMSLLNILLYILLYTYTTVVVIMIVAFASQ